MEYSAASLRRLRDRLMRYRLERRSTRRQLGWESVAENILNSPAVSGNFYDREESKVKVFAEALRRFAAGSQVLTTERLDALKAFLMDEGFLSEGDLVEATAPMQAILGLDAFFGERSNDVIAGRKALCGSFICVSKDERGRPEYRLLTVEGDGQSVLSLSETAYITGAETTARDRIKLERFFRRNAIAAIPSDGWLYVSGGAIIFLMQDRQTGQSTLRSVIFSDHGELGLVDVFVAVNAGLISPLTPLIPMHEARKVRSPMNKHSLIGVWAERHVWQFERQEAS